MPIYEYQCDECGERFEKLVRLSSPSAQVKCPRCSGHRVQKAISLCGTGKSAPYCDNSCAPAGG